MAAQASLTAKSWHRLSRRAVAACLFLLSAWPSSALAANPPWWNCSYGYRKQITVTAGSTAVPNGYSVSLTLDHSSLVSAGKSLASGNDVRVLYWNGSAWVELDRVLDPGSVWNSSSTRIWFKLQTGIGSSSSDNNYYLYYGNASASNAPAIENNVFHFADFFDRADNGSVGQGWTVTQSTGDVDIFTNALFFNQTANLYNRPLADHTFTAITDRLLWRIGFNWVRSGSENTYRLHMQLGNSANMANPPSETNFFSRAGVGPSLLWAGPDQGMTNHEGFGYEVGGTVTQAQVVSGTAKIEAIVNVSAGTYDLYINDVLRASGVAFSSAQTSIDQLRFLTWELQEFNFGSRQFLYTLIRRHVNPEPTTTLGGEQTPSVNYFAPDAAAAGMNVPVIFVGNFCGVPTVTTSSSDIIVGPSIMTDSTGAVVSSGASVLTTMFFIKPDGRPGTGITVSINGTPLTQTFDLVIPTPDPNITSGSGSLSGRTKRGTKVLGGLTVASGGTLTIDTTDTDGGTPGNQGHLPGVILVKGDVNIAGTIDINGQNGTNGGSSCSGGDGGAGGPGGGGGGGGGVKETSCSGGSITFDAASSFTTQNDTATFNHTIGGGADRLLVVCAAVEGNSPAYDVTAVTYNGVAMTKAVERTVGTNPAMNTEIWYLLDANLPAAGTYTVSVTTSSGSIEVNAGVISVTGAKQQGPEATASNTDGQTGASTIQTTITTVTNDAWVFDCVGSGNAISGFGPDPGQTERTDIVGTTSRGASSTEDKSTAGSETQGWTATGSNRLSHTLAAFAPAPPTGATAAQGGAGLSGGGGGGSKGSGTGGAGGSGTGAAGAAASGTTGGAGGTAPGGATGGGGGGPDTDFDPGGGGGGGGGTGNPFGTGGIGATSDGAAGGQGGGGGGGTGNTPGGGGGGGFATAGTRGPDDPDSGYGGNINGNAQLVPLMGGSGGAGGGPDVQISSANRGGGGGGGAGAVQIFATGSITVSGTITAAGGNGGNGYSTGGNGSGGGGGGSGGAILLQSGNVTTSGTLTTAGGAGGTSNISSKEGGAGGSGRIRIDGRNSGSTVPGTAGSKFIGPVIDTLIDTTVKGRADGGSTVTLYVYDQTGAQVIGSPYTTSASGSSGTVGTWTISNVTFPSGIGYLAVKQSSGSYAVLGPGRATKGIHLINWREVY